MTNLFENKIFFTNFYPNLGYAKIQLFGGGGEILSPKDPFLKKKSNFSPKILFFVIFASPNALFKIGTLHPCLFYIW